MREIKCDGCGLTESSKVPEKDRKIESVEFIVIPGSRYWSENSKMISDLCETCIGTLVENYFGYKPEGSLDVPDFLKENTPEEPEPKPEPVEVP